MFVNFITKFIAGYENTDQNTSFTKYFYQWVQNWFWKQELELFLLLPDLRSKNFFYKMFLTFTNESKTGFENRIENSI